MLNKRCVSRRKADRINKAWMSSCWFCSDLKNTRPRFIFSRKGTRGTTCHVQYLYQLCLEKPFSSEVNRYIHIHGTVALWRKPLRKPPRRKPLSRMMKIAAGSRPHLAGSLSYSFAILSAFTSRLRNAFRTIIRFRTKSCIHFAFIASIAYVSRVTIFARRFREIKLGQRKEKIREIFITVSRDL